VRVAALYDIHGNLPALEAVLADDAFADADAVVLGGDVASGPMPAEVLDRLRRTAYDIDRAAQALRATGFPDADDLLRESLLEPADPASVARYFEDRATPRRG
jgi:hypothetical protein